MDMSDNKLRSFAVWCARRVQDQIVNARCLNALETADRYLKGEVTYEELLKAYEDVSSEVIPSRFSFVLYDADDAAWLAAHPSALDAARLGSASAARKIASMTADRYVQPRKWKAALKKEQEKQMAALKEIVCAF